MLLHVRTRKGKGYAPAEKNPTQYHGVGLFTPETGLPVASAALPTFTRVFSAHFAELAEDERIITITAAMPEGRAPTVSVSAFRSVLMIRASVSSMR